MEIKSNLTYGAIKRTKDASEAYAAKIAAKENRLATGQKMTEISSDAASLQIQAKTGDISDSVLENINAAASAAADVTKADEMIREANRRILENADDSMLAQANQTTAVVSNLLD